MPYPNNLKAAAQLCAAAILFTAYYFSQNATIALCIEYKSALEMTS